MCGRCSLGNVDNINSRFNLDIEEVYEVFPSNQILVKADSIFMVSWSFSPFWAKESIKLINARYETLKDKPSFKNTKRCGIFTNGWFEWKKLWQNLFIILQMKNTFLGSLQSTWMCNSYKRSGRGIKKYT